MPDTQVQACRDACLEAMGLVDINDADTSQQALILRAINMAGENISNAPASKFHFSDEWSEAVRASSTFDVGVTLDSKALVSTSITDNSWMKGQAILIGTDSALNRVVRSNSGGESGATLMMPYNGSTGTVSATVYNDLISLPDDFMRFKGDLTVVGRANLNIVDTRGAAGFSMADTRVSFGVPDTARIISRRIATGSFAPFIWLNALPNERMRIHCEYWRRVRPVTALTNERNDLVPMDFVNSILVPIVIGNLASISSSIQIDLGMVRTAHQLALNKLEDVGDVTGPTGEVTTSSGIFD